MSYSSPERIAAMAAQHDVALAYHLVEALARGAVDGSLPEERAATMRLAVRALSRALEQLHGAGVYRGVGTGRRRELGRAATLEDTQAVLPNRLKARKKPDQRRS